ncbi:thioredoxin domain-containing protein [SAR202 cluster bacterium AC-409-J13_OGT_754m]|nr:thioredoxin domain-containing protein [SAR202 cluster bacterium AC-409-J13_OGT_754m]
MANKLQYETSPYLLQHANNPVQWYPWGPEALKKAKEEDKPILLSVGYSACHWCHVMEHESFENSAIADLMNLHFVSIKVDREERPDIDSIYMQAVQALTGHGGWPMTVFLTPEGKPFYGGTYYPPEDRGGMPGFPRVLTAMAEAYLNRKTELANATSGLLEHLENMAKIRSHKEMPYMELIDAAFTQLKQGFDSVEGGFGMAPKFPQPMIYDFLLHNHHSTKNKVALHMVEFSLNKMANGGIYDQLGGGFHRYSTDESWLVPHFEKMLYDNALLASLYTHAFQATGKSRYRKVTEETIDYILREMTTNEGGFCSSQDADSENIEGKFFVWTQNEIDEALDNPDVEIFKKYFNVTATGNFEGKNILNITISSKELARKFNLTEHDFDSTIERCKIILLHFRNSRVAPQRDDKILTAWNGLTLRAIAQASSVFEREDYLEAAINNAHFIINNLLVNDRLCRTYKDGKAKLNGYLEDYSFLADGLLALYEATFDPIWFTQSKKLVDIMIDLFWDPETGLFYDTSKDHEALIIRPREFFDNATPSGSSIAVEVLVKLSRLTSQKRYLSIAETALSSMHQIMARYPNGMGRWLSSLDLYQNPSKDIVVIGQPTDPATKALLKVIHNSYIPNKILAGFNDAIQDSIDDIPLLNYRTKLRGKPTAYVCENNVCKLPVTDSEALYQQIKDL